ncbi:MAG: hypothetical protein AB7E30_05790 [Lawsonibacter sp.]
MRSKKANLRRCVSPTAWLTLWNKKISLQEYDIFAGFAYRYSYNTMMPIDFSRD